MSAVITQSHIKSIKKVLIITRSSLTIKTIPLNIIALLGTINRPNDMHVGTTYIAWKTTLNAERILEPRFDRY